MTLRDEKQAVRAHVLALRDALAPEQRAHASSLIAERIASMEGFRTAHVVLLTLPFRSEWDATLLARRAIDAGKIVAAPRVDPSARMLRPLRIADVDADIEPGYRGIPEPRAHATPVSTGSIDWVLVPGVAFDAAGCRLGYGGGYYDRLLPLVPRSAPRVAGAFDLQVLDRVPAAPHDKGVDWIVTERRLLDCTRDTGTD
jgi:5-formyltetrahydrofolate cyclo-ligase